MSVTVVPVETGTTARDRRGGIDRGTALLAGVAALVAAAALVLGVTTPARAGVFCLSGCVGFPYTDVAAFVPRDYVWMYPALLAALLVPALVTAVAFRVRSGLRPVAAVAAVLAVVGATVLVVDYAVQLMVVQPALLAGQPDGLVAWSQYNPHGLFLALENVGYAVFGAVFVLLGVALTGLPGAFTRIARAVLLAGGGLIVVALVVLTAVYGAALDVRFEVTGLTLALLVLVLAGGLLAVPRPRR
ncbi:MAG: hypothetical protein J0I34_32990 [Pseudonocardia sp.]|uniref:hypothetical protein n=1 Tax=unclassified Pseudonocardia TaxID=2619320 RepID=UPI00086DE91F|nr:MULTISPECIES: hypothetical protein [unclassified Pseudonocardia]MBN9113582.1 hypothetical protein [Pseudonocardia sp.]ODU29630.1 MAG: hypothetical protein ABS80_01610 [Pseudonocardia sp. SCN 72-51]ODV00471.1 MAG: hypothetical protein ABT15_29325 [Pseudonocardia sp. SCN 73-27]